MAIQKNYTHENKATPIAYWRYADSESTTFIDPQTSTRNRGYKVYMHGYTTKAARDAAAKDPSLLPDLEKEFLICNHKELVQKTRPATIKEKQRDKPWLLEDPNTDWKAIKHDIVLSEKTIEHKDFDELKKAHGGKNEAKVIYKLLKAHPNSRFFFSEGKDV